MTAQHTLPPFHTQHSALSLPWPVDWTQFFGSTRPLVLEIGFGTGTFLEHLAATHPDKHLVGLEISNQCLVKAERMIARHRYSHVAVIHSRAETALHHLFTPASLDAVYVNFPDPWFRKEHSHRRLMQRDTLDAIVSRLKPGGEFFLATDIRDYADMAADLLADTPALQSLNDGAWSPQPTPGRIVTKYEAKAHREGRSCYYFAWRRTEVPVPELPVIKEWPMPHIVLESPLSLDTIREAFAPFHAHDGDIHVGINEVFRGRNSLLFEIHASEPTIEQHTALSLSPHSGAGPGSFTLQMTTIGHPRPTRGIHLAVRGLADWILALSPEQSKIRNEKLADGE
ncbi:MAG: tRNA (guanosine(46)-N7)-methyltransferase TrmB [Pleurocapsa minor GSE-CHR-MK-17-07R]|jgi:tRNA (guanine-N7-)-methyltransferase|nr:tRNA (guanosine(46)-N7)-methyltransferase TrmB [Pleurocapsa minor GSE-CHR-MK 17-07R]